MTIIDFKVSVLKLNDVQRHSLYVALTLFNLTGWVQWWPRVIAGKRKLTAGVR